MSEDTNHKVLGDTLVVTNRVNALTIMATIIIIITSITAMNTDTATEVINQHHRIGILEVNLVSTLEVNLVSTQVDNPTDPTSPNAQSTQIVQTIHNVLLIPTLKNQLIQVRGQLPPFQTDQTQQLFQSFHHLLHRSHLLHRLSRKSLW